MAQSSDRPIGERLKIAMFALGSFDRREEVRDDGCSELLRFLRVSQNSTLNIFADERFAAKSEFDLEYFADEHFAAKSEFDLEHFR